MITPEPSGRGGPGFGAGAPGVPVRQDDIPVAAVAQAPQPPAAGGGNRPAHVPPPPPPAFPSGSGGYPSPAKKRPPARPVKKGGDAKALAVVTIVLLLAGVVGLGIMVFNSSTQSPPNLASHAPPEVPTSESKARATRIMEERLRTGAAPVEAPAEGPGKTPARKVPTPLAARDTEPQADATQELDISVGTTDLDRKEETETNRLYIIGQVRNNGARMVRSVPVLCRFYDAEGKALTSANNNQVAKAVVEWLAPGESAKFMIEWARTPDATIKKHTLELGKPEFAPGKYVALKIKSPQIAPTDSDTGARGEVTGSVHNGTGGVVSDVQIIVQLCDGSDNILRTLIGTPTAGQKLSPMQNGPFKLPFNGSSAEPNFTYPAVNHNNLELRAFGKVE